MEDTILHGNHAIHVEAALWGSSIRTTHAPHPAQEGSRTVPRNPHRIGGEQIVAVAVGSCCRGVAADPAEAFHDFIAAADGGDGYAL